MREAVQLADWRAIAALRGGDILEGDCALNVFAGEHGRVLPLHEDADVRGHGRGRGVGSGLPSVLQLIGGRALATWLPAGFSLETPAMYSRRSQQFEKRLRLS